jgi:radical SAM/CxCxxxxC motif protein YfkAB
MYSSNFTSNLEILSLDELRKAIHHLLDILDENVWMLFGTMPFYACSSNPEDLRLLERLYKGKNVTIRNDPDGRSRLNVNIFTGDIIVTDFAISHHWETFKLPRWKRLMKIGNTPNLLKK